MLIIINNENMLHSTYKILSYLKLRKLRHCDVMELMTLASTQSFRIYLVTAIMHQFYLPYLRNWILIEV